jgi:PAS domain S-box-containing protein
VLTSVRVPEAFAPIFEKAQEYVQRYFSGVRFSPEHGTIGIADERYVLVRAGSLSVEFFDVVRGLYGDTRDEGVSVAREILFDLAHAMGLADARVFAEKMGVTEPIDRLSAGPIHFAYAGWAFVDIHPESAPAPGDDYVLYYDHPYSMEADGWIAAGRVADFPVCVMNAGYSSGWCESSFGIPLVASEITCRAKGDPHCRFIMAPPHRIEGRIREYLAAHPGVVPEPTAIEVPGFFRRKSTSEALSARTEQLSAQNAELERRVAERTAALLRANEALSRELVERRETEAALRESEELNHRILEAVPSGIVHVALSGAIQSANAEAQQILGLSYDALTQRYTSDFASVTIWESGEPAAPEDYPVTRALATGLAQPPVTFGVRRPDGKTSWAIFRAVPVRDPHSREVSGAIVTFVDITQRKADEELRRRLEEKVQRSQKLESLGLLAGGIAHDFNNLLVGILGNASWLASGKAQGTREWEATQRIVTAGRRAADLTKQMLAYSGRARLETVRVNLPEVVREMHELLHASIPQSVRVEFEPVADALWVEGDPAQLGQVIMNLLTNAYEATSAAMRSAGERARHHHARDASRGCAGGHGRARARPGGGVRLPHGHGRWHRHGPRDHAARLRSVLHHQGARPRARARGRPRHHSRTPWRARHRLGAGPWDHLPRLHPRGAGPLEHEPAPEARPATSKAHGALPGGGRRARGARRCFCSARAAGSDRHRGARWRGGHRHLSPPHG